ncbi:hypothetical protein KKH23_07680 [Patescibacteria group bacterium]|nr:hypothetical protein [Patescibacteria group bacterium]
MKSRIINKEVIEERIENVLRRGVMGSGGRCWWLCYNIWKKLPKEIKNELFLAEGDCHYWLEDRSGNRYDIYARLYDIEYSEEEYRVQNYYNPFMLRMGSAFDERYCESSRFFIYDLDEYRPRMMEVHYFENLEEARIEL